MASLLIALCKIWVWKSTVSPVATQSQKCQWISWMDDGNLATIPSPFPCIQTEVISLGRHLHAWQRPGQDFIEISGQRFTANSFRKSVKFDDNWRSVKLDLRQLQSRHKTLEEDGGEPHWTQQYSFSKFAYHLYYIFVHESMNGFPSWEWNIEGQHIVSEVLFISCDLE